MKRNNLHANWFTRTIPIVFFLICFIAIIENNTTKRETEYKVESLNADNISSNNAIQTNTISLPKFEKKWISNSYILFSGTCQNDNLENDCFSMIYKFYQKKYLSYKPIVNNFSKISYYFVYKKQDYPL